MCLAAPARVLAIGPADAVVDLDGRQRRASLAFQPEIAIGDWVLVAAGSIVRRIDATEADDLRQLLRPVLVDSLDGPADSSQGARR